mmetsp:Transcript_72469/g.116856  ORF Transcript_72469/g.116856 Transcript_72469/m.116856 type:complete len:213 (+) Transcript_72469:547-1185(+)
MDGASPSRMEMERNQVSFGALVEPCWARSGSGVIFCRMVNAGKRSSFAGLWSRQTQRNPSVDELSSMSDPYSSDSTVPPWPYKLCTHGMPVRGSERSHILMDLSAEPENMTPWQRDSSKIMQRTSPLCSSSTRALLSFVRRSTQLRSVSQQRILPSVSPTNSSPRLATKRQELAVTAPSRAARLADFCVEKRGEVKLLTGRNSMDVIATTGR